MVLGVGGLMLELIDGSGLCYRWQWLLTYEDRIHKLGDRDYHVTDASSHESTWVVLSFYVCGVDDCHSPHTDVATLE